MISRSQASTYPPAGSVDRWMPEAFNFSLAGLHVFLNLFQLFILPLYLLPKSLWWSLFLIPIACLNNAFWALVHVALANSFGFGSNNAMLGYESAFLNRRRFI